MVEIAGVAKAVEAVGGQLVSFQHLPDASFLRLPLIYPSGSAVTAKITRSGKAGFTISDAGFAYRELESYGMQRSFARAADGILDAWAVSRDTRCVFAEVELDELPQGIMDVGTASWQIVDRIYARIREDHEEAIQEYVTDRLVKIFGRPAVSAEAALIGASTSSWEVTALVRVGGKRTAFQAVSSHANSVYRANTAFDDLAALDDAPGLVAVVENKAILGPKLTLLARQSAVIESAQPDADYRKVAA